MFGRDLRLGDHAGLAQAARLGDVIAAYVSDPRTAASDARNPRRAAFRLGAVASLARDLTAQGARLVVRSGARRATVVRLAHEAQADAVVWSASYDAADADADRSLQSALEEAGIRATIVHDAPAVAPDDTAAARSGDGGHGYRALGPYVSAWLGIARAPIATRVRFAQHDLASDDAAAAAPVAAVSGDAEIPSEAAALARVRAYLAGPILSYPAARYVPANEVPTARISASLAFGLVSARTVLALVEARERDPFLLAEERAAMHAFVRAVARRDFFLQLAWFFEDGADVPFQERMRAFRFERDHPALRAWCEGRTGYPIVDAGVRQLRATGWMHPRVRSVVASFLCFDLGVDWRVGRDVWERELIEDEAALASGNWQWVCGVGADLAQFPRIYNPRKALRSMDPRGVYVRRWIPELAHVPDAELFARPGSREDRQLALALYERAAYPAPVVEHEVVARTFLQRYAAYVAQRERIRP